MPHGMRCVMAFPAVLAMFGCDSGSATTSVAPPQHVSDLPVSAGGAVAGYGWTNRPIPQHDGGLVTIEFTAFSYDSSGPIDGVIGFSSQPAQAFTDLGPILRFNPDGHVDARDRGAYAAATSFAYAPNTEYDVRFDIDLAQHIYTARIRIADSRVGDPFHTIAENYAFRTEQQTLSHLDNVASYIDSSAGGLASYEFSETPDVCVTGAPGWVAFPFPTQTGQFWVQIDATANPTGREPNDSVVGVSRDRPEGFSDLAAILRFRPDGYLDARDGSTYRSDVQLQYVPGDPYRVYFLIDQTAKTYSVEARDMGGGLGGNQTEEWIGKDYAFRTEQQDVISLGWAGAFVDESDSSGDVRICNLVASPEQ